MIREDARTFGQSGDERLRPSAKGVGLRIERGQFQPVLGQRRIILKDLLGGDARRQCGRDVVNRNARAADDRGAAHDVIGDGDHLARGVQPFQPCDGTLEEGQKVDGQEVLVMREEDIMGIVE